METVLFYDVESRRVVRIPVSELRPGAVQARVQGIDEIVWVVPEQLKEGPLRHGPFPEEVRAVIRQIQETFAEFYPLSLEEWEDGFRRDANPAQEIAIWSHAATVYREFVEAEERTAEQRQDAYRVVVSCMTASPDTVWHVIQLSALSRPQAEQIVNRFYGAST
jgi:hypothetical protein